MNDNDDDDDSYSTEGFEYDKPANERWPKDEERVRHETRIAHARSAVTAFENATAGFTLGGGTD